MIVVKDDSHIVYSYKQLDQPQIKGVPRKHLFGSSDALRVLHTAMVERKRPANKELLLTIN